MSMAEEMVKIQVDDTGIGMDREQLEKLIEKESKSLEMIKSESGLGLGLPISMRLARKIGDGIKLSSVLKEGTHTEFTVKCWKPEATVELINGHMNLEDLPDGVAEESMPIRLTW